MTNNPSRIFDCPTQLHIAHIKWSKEFSVAMKGKKFESHKFKFNPVAKALRTPAFRSRIVEDKTKYNRKRSKDL